ncbi:MAG: protein kinase [Planctomycetes bacterium]|nr:protein kinase [Planctomycetota bacterium]
MVECPSPQRLSAYFEGMLPVEDIQAIEAHLQSCTTCASHLREQSQPVMVASRMAGADQPDPAMNVADPIDSSAGLRPLSSAAALEETKTFADGGSEPDRSEGAKTSTRQARPPSTGALPEIPGYTIAGEIGRGGMGVVLKARHTVLNREVAIKMPLAHYLDDPSARIRFLREARSAAMLSHPNICPIHDVGEVGDKPYLAFSYVRGNSLRDWAKQQPPTARKAAEIVALVARAVDHAHAHGVIHRDIKPANVMIEATTLRPVLMDFGLAKELADHSSDLTHTGQVMGTPSYMAPEQAAGRMTEIGPLSDVYSLGVVLYELLTGQQPFRGSVGEVLRQVQTDEPVEPRKLVPHIHRDLETICLKAMAKEPARRYATALALAEDLERFCAGEAILARQEPMVVRLWRKTRRRWSTIAAATIAVTAILCAAYLAQSASRTRQVNRAVQEFDALLKDTEWTPEQFNQLESQLAGLQQLAPQAASRARDRLWQSVDESVKGTLRRGRLTVDEVVRLEAFLTHIEPRATELATSLRRELTERLRRWNSELELKAPFSDLATVFVPGTVAIEGSDLARGPVPRPPDVTGNTRSKPVPADLRVNTLVPCRGNVQLHAVFSPSWRQADRLGIVLNSNRAGGYLLRLTVAQRQSAAEQSTAPASGVSFATAASEHGTVTIQVLRNGVPLRKQTIDAASLPTESLTLTMGREGERVTAQVAQLPPLSFEDLFPLNDASDGVFAIEWPESARLERLEVLRQLLPSASRPLERGDELYSKGEYVEALAEYRQDALTASEASVNQEARFKESMTLVALGQSTEAMSLFERLTTEQGSRWPLAAACHLWSLYLQEDRLTEADALFETLSSRFRFEELAAYLPDDLRSSILSSYSQTSKGLGLLMHDPTRVRHMERMIAVMKFLGEPRPTVLDNELQLIRALRREGRTDEALLVARRDLHVDPGEASTSINAICSEYGWMMRELGQPQTGLETLDVRLYSRSSAEPRPECLDLLLERARLNAALERWETAERDLQDYLRLVPEDQREFHISSSVVLMLGFLRERTGDSEGARAAWQLIPISNAQIVTPRYTQYNSMAGFGGIAVIQALILGSLSDSVSDREIDVLMARGLSSLGSSRASLLKTVYVPPPSLMREMWRTPRGRDVARRIAFQQGSLTDFVCLPFELLLYEVLRENAFGSVASSEQEELIWDLANQLAEGTAAGRISEGQLAQFALTWKGTTNFLGWAGLAPSLTPQMRASSAYVFGHRFRRLKQPDAARRMFQTTATDAAPDSTASRLARQELDADPPP